jgi:hypothetical protein
MQKKLEVLLTREKETPNTIRYAENDGDSPVLVYQYVRKSALERLVNPEKIKVTIEAV